VRDEGNHGFTLLELLLVLVIMAGLGFVLMVRLPVHAESRVLAQASTQLLSDLRDTRQAALSENTWYQVKFYSSSNFYRITRQGIWVRDVYLPNGVKLLNQPPDLNFNASGIPSAGMTILLGTAAGEQKKVIVAPVTGRIREE